MRDGEDASAGKECEVTYRSEWSRWDITMLECEDDEIDVFAQKYAFAV